MCIALWTDHECNFLANCRPLNVSVHCCLVFVRAVLEAIVHAYS